MIALGGTTITALTPWLLAALPLATGFLIYIYRKRGNTSQQVVSSLFLMRKLPKATPGRRRFMPPLQFWFELLLFLLLTCAAATIILEERGRHVAVVIDTSRSMGAVDPSATSRLDKARSYASADIAQALPLTRFTVFAAHSTLAQVSQRGVSSPSAVAAVNSPVQTQTADKLSTHLESLLSQGTFDAVWVYTDHALQEGVMPTRSRIVTIPAERSEKSNLWLAGLSVKSVEDSSSIQATIESSLTTPGQASVAATCFTNDSTPFELPPIPVTVPPTTQQNVQLPLGAQRPWSYCRVALTALDNSLDNLRDDNQGWITNNKDRSSLQVVSPLSPQELGLAQIKSFDFLSSRDAGTTNSPTIYHRTAPPTAPLTTPTLFIYPPLGELPQDGAVTTELKDSLDITRWDSSHPLLKYVNPTLLKLPVARMLRCPAATTPFLFSQTGPLACAGEAHGIRYGAIGFELFPFDGKQNPTLSIFTLNLLTWLSNSSASSSHTKQPGLISLPIGTTSARYLAPSEEPLTIDQSRPTAIAPHPGVVALHTDNSDSLVAINLFANEESDLTKLSPISLPAADREIGKREGDDRNDITPWLAILALLTLVADLIRRLITKQKWVVS